MNAKAKLKRAPMLNAAAVVAVRELGVPKPKDSKPLEVDFVALRLPD